MLKSKLAYLECPTGISGDMLLGALVDLGVPLEYLIKGLNGLNFADEYQLKAYKVHRQGQQATKVDVALLHSVSHAHEGAPAHDSSHHSSRHLPEIENMIQGASLPPRVMEWSLKVFRQLAIAEGAVHGIPPEKVHFHEVGATDAIVDIVGTCLGLDYLNIEELHCSPLPTGGGTVKAAHGVLSVPVPAVLKLWEMASVPVYSNGIQQELVTPTGAALVTSLASHFGDPPPLTVKKIGLGAGSKDFSLPNIVRLWLGEYLRAEPTGEMDFSSTSEGLKETIAVLETQIDDMNPQGIAYTSERLFEAGALDVFTTAIAMKKSRLGTLLTVICPVHKMEICQEIIFQETSSIGIRYRTQERQILAREIKTIETEYGSIRVKIARQGERILNIKPEYEDCAKLAKTHHKSWSFMHQLALSYFEAKE